MPVNISRDGQLVEYKPVEVPGGDIMFSLQDECGNEIELDVPLVLNNSFSSKEFDVYYLCKRDTKESDIFQVYVRDQDTRIGWMIPVLALSSTLHDYAENEHFLKYAYIAIREALNRLDRSIYYTPVDGNEARVGLSDIFHEYTSLLVISKETLTETVKFDIHRASLSLIKYGYVRLGQVNPERIRLIKDAPSGNRLYLEQIASSINNEKLICELLNNSFAFESSPVFKFFLLYQLVELLMEEVYRIEQEDIVNELIKSKDDIGKTKDLLGNLSIFVSEKNRLTLLVQKYFNKENELSELKRLCNLLLDKLGRKQEEAFHGYFYGVRNFIFHQCRDFPVTEVPSLEAIVDEFLDVLPYFFSGFGVQKLD